MSDRHELGRRKVLKKGAIVGASVGAASFVTGSAAAANYDYELVVKAVNGSGQFQAGWSGFELVEAENLENGDWVDNGQSTSPWGYHVDLSVDDTFNPIKDIVRFNADSIDPYRIDWNGSKSNIEVTVSSDSQTKTL